ncbi:MraY family glycosyltransferase [Streptomyces sp. NPDC005808]|uniref:MraY family glycosyltransferase n=1 Tax=Streptomyces sp. NPDC005808 TaxID=3364734 RepID=UPI00368CB26A
MLYGIVAALAALLLAAVLAALLRMFALRFGVVQRRPRRSRAVPLLGGVAVLGGTVLVAGVGEWTEVAPLGADAGRLLVVGAGVGLLGLVADLRAVPLGVQVTGVGLAAVLTVPYGQLGVLGAVLGIVWTVLVTFAFVSLDHADGVMGTVGVVTAFALSGCAAAEVMDGTTVLLSVLAAALAGFLMQGRPPARIVPGRCGALFAGFVLASAAVLVHGGRETGSGVAALFSLTAVGLADLALAARGPGGHLAQRLRRVGLTSRGAVVVIGTAAFGAALVGLLIDLGWVGAGAAWWVAGGVAVVVLVAGAGPVSRPRRPYPFPSPGARGGAADGRRAPRPPVARRGRHPQVQAGLKTQAPDRLKTPRSDARCV